MHTITHCLSSRCIHAGRCYWTLALCMARRAAWLAVCLSIPLSWSNVIGVLWPMASSLFVVGHSVHVCPETDNHDGSQCWAIVQYQDSLIKILCHCNLHAALRLRHNYLGTWFQV